MSQKRSKKVPAHGYEDEEKDFSSCRRGVASRCTEKEITQCLGGEGLLVVHIVLVKLESVFVTGRCGFRVGGLRLGARPTEWGRRAAFRHGVVRRRGRTAGGAVGEYIALD
jgi:hypothetical protein